MLARDECLMLRVSQVFDECCLPSHTKLLIAAPYTHCCRVVPEILPQPLMPTAALLCLNVVLCRDVQGFLHAYEEGLMPPACGADDWPSQLLHPVRSLPLQLSSSTGHLQLTSS